MFFATGLVIWNSDSGETNQISYSVNDKVLTLTVSGKGSLKITGKRSIPKVYTNCEFVVDPENGSPTESYAGTQNAPPITCTPGNAIAIVPGSKDKEDGLEITSSFSFGDHNINSDGTITIENGGLLVLGCGSTRLSGEYGSGIVYKDTYIADTTNGGKGTLIVETGSELRIKSNARVHIGSYIYGNGNLTLEEGKTLTIGDVDGNDCEINIGASTGSGQTGPGTTTNTMIVEANCNITESFINLGGGCCNAIGSEFGGDGENGTNYDGDNGGKGGKGYNGGKGGNGGAGGKYRKGYNGGKGGNGGAGYGGNGGNGGIGEDGEDGRNGYNGGQGGNGGYNGKSGDTSLTISPNSEDQIQISSSIVFIGSSGGLGGNGGNAGNADGMNGRDGNNGGQGGNGGNGGAGTLTISSSILNSIVFVGSSGGNGGDGRNNDGAPGGAGGNGGDGTLNISSTVSNSIVFVGSSGGNGGDAGGGSGPNLSGGGGGGPNGGDAGGGNGGAGASNTLTISGNDQDKVTNKLILFGTPASFGSDKSYNLQIDSIDHCIVFCGIGNFNDYGMRRVALNRSLHGYLGQVSPINFATLTPGTLTLPDGTTTFTINQEFPRGSGWDQSNPETPIEINLRNVFCENSNGESILKNPTTEKFVFQPYQYFPSTRSNLVVINPMKEDYKDFSSVSGELLEIGEKGELKIKEFKNESIPQFCYYDGSNYHSLILSGVTGTESGSIIPKKDTAITFSGTTINSEVDVSSLDDIGTIGNIVVNTPIQIKGSYALSGVTFDSRKISVTDSNQKPSSLSFSVVEDRKTIGFTDSSIDKSINYNTDIRLATTTLLGNCSTNLRNQFTSDQPNTFTNGTITVSSNNVTFTNSSIGAYAIVRFTAPSTASNTTFGSGTSIDLNTTLNNLTFTKEGQNTIVKSSTEQELQFIQDNVTINTLSLNSSSTFSYDSTTLFCDNLDLKNQSLTISNNSIRNDGETVLSFSNPFQIGSTNVIASTTNQLVLNQNASVTFIGSGDFTPTVVLNGSNIVYNGQLLEYDGEYLIFPEGTHSGVSFNANGQPINIEGTLSITGKVGFKFESSFEIPPDSSLSIESGEETAKININIVSFVGSDITIKPSSVDDPIELVRTRFINSSLFFDSFVGNYEKTIDDGSSLLLNCIFYHCSQANQNPFKFENNGICIMIDEVFDPSPSSKLTINGYYESYRKYQRAQPATPFTPTIILNRDTVLEKDLCMGPNSVLRFDA